MMRVGRNVAVVLVWVVLHCAECFHCSSCVRSRNPSRGGTKTCVFARVRPKRPVAAQQRKEELEELDRCLLERREEALKDPTLLSKVQFSERSDLHPNSKRALQQTMGLQSMTQIQLQTYQAALHGKDVMARARTGTGKTLAFLLPAVEQVIHSQPAPATAIPILVISPTRELALQTADQAHQLLAFHSDMTVMAVYGGTKIIRDTNAFNKRLPTVLVATPGRLIDHLKTTTLNGGRNFGRDIMPKTKILVLDETDSLLDMGFRNDIQNIISYLPRTNKRQTLCFSATIPKHMTHIIKRFMKDDYVTVDTTHADHHDESTNAHKLKSSSNTKTKREETNSRVTQTHIILPKNSMDQYASFVLKIILHAMAPTNSNNNNSKNPNKREAVKIVAFFPTAKMVSYFASLLTHYIATLNNNNNNNQTNNDNNNIPILELHSKKSQGHRTRTSNAFRKTKNAILLTSDVSARGIDYPGVTHVLQFGLPESREQYIHRLGRTARAGNEGKGWLILNQFEQFFVEKDLADLNIPRDERLHLLLMNQHQDNDTIEGENECQNNDLHQDIMQQIQNTKYNEEEAQNVYRSFLGYYTSQIKRLPKTTKEEELVSIAHQLAVSMGLHGKDVLPPPLTKRMVTKMGLKGVKGIRVVDSLLSPSFSSSSLSLAEKVVDFDNEKEVQQNNDTVQNEREKRIIRGEKPRRRQRKETI